MNDRQRIIEEGIKRNKSVKEINTVLNQYGLEGFNPLTYTENYKRAFKNFAPQMIEFARDLRTQGGAIAKPILQTAHDLRTSPYKTQVLIDAFKEGIKNKDMRNLAKGAVAGAAIGKLTPITTLGGAVVGGIAGLAGQGDIKKGAKNIANAVLKTYNTNINQLAGPEYELAKNIFKYKNSLPEAYKEYKRARKENPYVDWKDVAQGVFNNPFYATLDTAPIWGPHLTKGVSKLASSVPENAPQIIQEFLPSKQLREFNRDLTESIGAGKVKASDLYEAYGNLETMPLANRKEIARYIMTNKGNLSKRDLSVAKTLKKDLVANQNKLKELGLVDEVSQKNDIIAQYVMQNIKDKSNLLHMDIVNILNKEPLRDTAKQMLSTNLKKEIDSLIKKGNKLYDEEKIALLTQKFATSEDPLRQIIASDMNKGSKDYFDTTRIIGRSGVDELSNVFDKSIKFQLDQVGETRQALSVLEDVMDNPKINNLITGEAKTNAVEAFKKSIKNDLDLGEMPNFQKAFSKTGLNKNIGNIYYQAVRNSFGRPTNTGTRRLLNTFKKAVLATPHWFILNRIGNISNNAMDGVKSIDYLDAIGKYGKIAPKQLKTQTSFANYIMEGIEGVNTTGKSMGAPIARMKNTITEFRNTNKGSKDVGAMIRDVFSSSGDITANPVFKIESTAEFTDRYANFIRQAKREAKLRYGNKFNSEDVTRIIKESNNNQQLFNKLNTQVNKALGDYVGRNYAIPNEVYNVVSEVQPFYRFLAQTGRTTAHQLAHNPLAFHSLTTIPARVGNKLSEYYINKYNLDKEQYKGGVPYLEQNGNIRTLGFEPLPVGAVSEQFGNWLQGKELQNIAHPVVASLIDATKFQKFNKPATNPRLTKLKLTNPAEAEKFQPTLEEIFRYGGNTLLQNTWNPWIWSTRLGPELYNTFSKNPGLQSRYDTNPFTENPLSYNKELPVELTGKWLGFQTASNYPKYKLSKSAMKRNIAKANRNKQKVKNLKDSKTKRSL